MIELFSSHSIRTRLPTWMSRESRTIERSVRNVVVPIMEATVNKRESVLVRRRHRSFMALKDQRNNSNRSRKKCNWTRTEKSKGMIYEMQFQFSFSLSLSSSFSAPSRRSSMNWERGLRQSFTCLDRWLMTRSTSLRLSLSVNFACHGHTGRLARNQEVFMSGAR